MARTTFDLSPREYHDLWDLHDDGYQDMLAVAAARSDRRRAELLADATIRHHIETDPRASFDADGNYPAQHTRDDGDPVV